MGFHGVVYKNISHIIEWSKLSADQGCEPAQINLAELYEMFNDLKKGVFWYEKAVVGYTEMLEQKLHCSFFATIIFR